ncbi:MAG: TonB-dependent receptor plug domain-containing protein [Candidatus Loosdrechtia sp.]|uniref:TonB-dependent receptor plug domain-containing protein n=1 Tax=Candidatus Loosdrechtia sp. TaxID=3101272 RepID=UPI003A65FDA1|nr:MAG: TonB-dependent receptor [Candidatus Jettenia sp. AMX2]
MFCIKTEADVFYADDKQESQYGKSASIIENADKTEIQGEKTALNEEAAMVKEVVVVGNPVGENFRLNDPVPQTGVSRETFENRFNMRAGDMIKRMPGVTFEGPPGENQDVRLLGLDKEFTRVQLDGIQLPGAGEKREFQVNRISAFLIDDVRVIRNPTAEYESDGIAGRVDVRTRPIPEKLTIHGRLGYGTRDGFHDSFWHQAVGFGIRPTKWFGIMAAFDNLEDVFEKDKSRIESTGKTEKEDERVPRKSRNMYLDLGFFYGPGEFHIKPLYLDRDEDKRKRKVKEDITKPEVSNEELETEFERKFQKTVGIGLHHLYTFREGIVWDTLIGYYVSNEKKKDKEKLKFKEKDFDFVLDKTEFEKEDKEDETWNFSSSLLIPFELGLRQELKFGGALRFRDRFRDKSEKFEVDSKGNIKDLRKPKDSYALSEDYHAAFVQNQVWVADRFSVLPGVRLEYVELNSRSGDGTKGESTFTDINPSLHLLYQFRDDVSFRGAVSRGVNRPKFDELSPFEQEEDKKIKIGNPNLEPARSWNFNLGSDYVGKYLMFGINLFYKNISDVIEEIDTGIVRDGKEVFRIENVGDGWVRGVELEQRVGLGMMNIPALNRFILWANESFLDSELKDAGGKRRRFKDQPRFVSNLGFDYIYEPFGAIFTASWNYIGERKNIEADKEKTIKPFSTIDLAVRQRVVNRLNCFVEVENVTDEKRREKELKTDGTLASMAESNGRTFWFGLEYKF